MKIKEITFIRHDNLFHLIDELNDCIKSGWQPYGELKLHHYRGSIPPKFYVQSMVKYEEEPRSYSYDEKTGIKTPIDIKAGSDGKPGYIPSVKDQCNDGHSPTIKFTDIKFLTNEEIKKLKHKFMGYRDNFEPFLDWQENRPDNKPKEGVELIVKLQECSWNFNTVKYINGKFCCPECSEYSKVKQWAYIPE